MWFAAQQQISDKLRERIVETGCYHDRGISKGHQVEKESDEHLEQGRSQLCQETNTKNTKVTSERVTGSHDSLQDEQGESDAHSSVIKDDAKTTA